MANFLNNRGTKANSVNNVNPAPAQQSGNATHQLANIIKNMKGINSPQGLIQMFSGNPQQMQQIQALMNSGRNPQQLAMSLMQKRGIDPNELMKELNS